MLGKILAVILLFPAITFAESRIAGYGGFLKRVQAQRLEFAGFRSYPASSATLTLGLGGGTSIWKVQVDGSFLFSRTGETNVFRNFNREIEETVNGSALMAEAGAGWPLIEIAGFQTTARAGYGTARIRVPTQIPIEDDRGFWTYGFSAKRDVGSRFVLLVDARNLHFRGEAIPLTLGRYNIVILTGFGVRF